MDSNQKSPDDQSPLPQKPDVQPDYPQESDFESAFPQELAALEKIASAYNPSFQAALEQVGGVDLGAIASSLKSVAGESDPEALAELNKTLTATYAPLLQKALDIAQIDRDTVWKELNGIVPLATGGHFVDTLLLSWGLLFPPEPTPPPPPAANEVHRRAPYDLQSSTGGDLNSWANKMTGEVWSDQEVWEVGSSQALAAVGATVMVEPDVRQVRVDATASIVLGRLFIMVTAILGYASAEVILNLKVLDGSRLVASDRLSILHGWTAVAGSPLLDGGGDYNLSCTVDRAGVVGPSTYSVLVEVETWVGVGAVVGQSRAHCWATVQQISLYFSR